ncbi:ankyrin repeat domain-containing protein 13C [Histomonas meleagridis]|uniref:ankyrin repeat domain-containing protein 13C n=1 Tax=Histomonas meleagridis TaxID=135588 RepID=UPI003559BBD8|nr:ankyrin repeat domain-containing protein 13C [Histomonas meleagridis]KAH0807076.1 ankyrin repeat domain-containing protein 13C [Histomonas meleagridis]
MNEDVEALFNAIKEKRFDDADRLLESGVDTRITDDKGLTPVDYAQLSGNVDFFKKISFINRRINVHMMTEKFPQLCQHFLSIPDFQMKFKWQVYSWIPFISAFCPSDTWLISKVGSKLRIDTTLANWNNYRFTRGSTSVFFDANSPDMLDSFIVIDNVSGQRFSVLREIIESNEIENDIDNLMKMDLLKGSINPETIHHKPSKNFFGWRIRDSLHQNRYQVTPSDLSNVKVKFTHFLCDDFGKENIRPLFHEKTYSGRFWCSREFPVQPSMLIPFFEALSPFKDTCRNILMLLGMFEDGMPLKAIINVFPTVKLSFEFIDFEDNTELYHDYVNLPMNE